MNHKRVAWVACLLCLGLLVWPPPEATGQPKDPAARGLDVFVHVPKSAAPGAEIPVQVQVLGFSTVTTAKPLPEATVEAVWDPKSLGKGVSVAPKGVTGKTDGRGRAHLMVPVPAGPKRDLSLLIGARFGSHQRTRAVTVSRLRAHEIQVFVADRQVVPGSTISAWVLVRKATTKEPVKRLPVDLNLLEGGTVRSKAALTTDAAGSAAGRIQIPRSYEPSWTWTLEARVVSKTHRDAGRAKLTLTPREETPGTPRMWAEWTRHAVEPGATASFVVRVRDAADEPVAAHRLSYWIGPTGTEPPRTAEEWNQIAKTGSTNIAGELRGSRQAPTTVARRVGTDLRLVVRTSVEGRELEAKTSVHVGAPAPTVEVLPAAGTVMGGIRQQLLLRARDGWGRPIVGSFAITGDGLDAKVTTSSDGEGQLHWSPPRAVGAHRGRGPCAHGVAAAVVVRPLEDRPAFGGSRAPIELCVPIDRKAPGMVHVDHPVVRAGDPLHVEVRGKTKLPWSVTLTSHQGAQAASAWLDDGAAGAKVTLPPGSSGLWTVSAVTPGRPSGGRALPATILVVPRTLPVLTAVMAGGRAAPGGEVYVDAVLSDGHGKGLTGTVAAVAFDLHGGGSARGLRAIDTRLRLCDAIDVADDRCSAILEGDAALDGVRRGLLGARPKYDLEARLDPGATAEDELKEAFGSVVRSLEGAVYESSQFPDRLRDVGRKGAGGKWTFNPELWTLATAAMDPKPQTPGGEPFVLADLVAIDPQVTFDKVARRVTRLKIFRVQAAVHRFIQDHYLSPDEPALADPPALLRRLVRDNTLSNGHLLDPWGGTLQFVKVQGKGLPFLTVRGYQLQAPGPDGRIGTGDDVKGPFERVLRSGSPYAKAVGEDRIVDAKLDMRVADATVTAWGDLLEELTGTRLGHGSGTGTGQGFGSGHGRLGRSHRARPPRVRMGHSIVTGDAVWLPPKRTDKNGKVRLTVPLGDIETTWQVALLGLPDRAQPAVATVDIPIAMPLSARVDAGAQWTVGDQVDVQINLRNRTQQPVQARLAIAPRGVAKLGKPGAASQTVSVPAMGAAATSVRVTAPKAGSAGLEVRLSAPKLKGDVVRHQWHVRAAGEPTRRAQLGWVDRQKTMTLPHEPKRATPVGPTRLVVERGQRPLLRAALHGVDPDRTLSPDAVGDAFEVATRIHRWVLVRRGHDWKLRQLALDVAERAKGKLRVYAKAVGNEDAVRIIVARLEPLGGPVALDEWGKPSECPPTGVPTLPVALQHLEAEPAPVAGVVRSCWDSFVTDGTDVVQKSGDPVALARTILALSERPHRRSLAQALAARLREQVALEATGRIQLPASDARNPAARAIVYSALLRTVGEGDTKGPDQGRLIAWLSIQRDPHGGYGSSLATRLAVTALLAVDEPTEGNAHVTVEAGGERHDFILQPISAKSLPLPKGTTKVVIRSSRPGLIARLERRTLRRWSRPPSQRNSPAKLDITWPSRPTVGQPARLQVSLRHDLGYPATLDARIPLPPGVSLAAPTKGVRQVQGVLAIRRELDSSALPNVMQIPIRFELSGRVTAPEAQARLAFEQAARAVAPARRLDIR